MRPLDRSQISLGNFLHSLYSFDRFLACAQALRIENLELWGAGPHFFLDDYDDERAKEFYKRIEACGMKVICMTPEQCVYPINIACDDRFMRQRSIDYFKRAVEMCAIMQCDMLLVTPGRGYFDYPIESAWQRCVAALQEIGTFGAKHGVRLAFEHLTSGETNIAVYAKEAARLVRDVGLSNVGGMVDLDMAARVGEGAAEYLDAFGGKLLHMHLVDGMPGGHMVPGDGVIDLQQQLITLANADYTGYITPEVMEKTYRNDPETALRRTIYWMESVFAKIADSSRASADIS